MAHEQLDFEVLLNASVQVADEARLSRQAAAILALFRSAHAAGREVTTVELVKIACQYNARINEIRRALVPVGWCIDCLGPVAGRPGVNRFALVRKSESTFYAKHQDRF